MNTEVSLLYILVSEQSVMKKNCQLPYHNLPNNGARCSKKVISDHLDTNLSFSAGFEFEKWHNCQENYSDFSEFSNVVFLQTIWEPLMGRLL